MTTTAILTFLAIAGFIWGGFLLILLTAVRKERARLAGDGGRA